MAEGVEEVPKLDHVDGSTCHFTDGSTRDIDAIILCTGYQHHFPFMEDRLRLVTDNVLYPDKLYKGVFWEDNPNVMYIAMQDQYYTFTHFDVEAWLARDHVLGRFKLPSKKEMRADIEEWMKREGQCENAFDEIDFQADHVRDLMALTDYPDFDVQKTVEQWKEWEHDKDEQHRGLSEQVLRFADHRFAGPCTMATPWLQKMDDSMQSFMTDIVSPEPASPH
ncbi:MAG: hypothetical protein U5K73_09645 [Halofilum sp. (in: g-proteobacteria)]|nr:hypothetical protein [Halofilum sp. (in: g-proteobacteria)]